jgi:uncharacterized protein (TIGR03790 family)
LSNKQCTPLTHFPRGSALAVTLSLCLLFAVLYPVHAQNRARTENREAHGIDRSNIAVVINAADPLSQAIGEYYAVARRIPPENIVRVAFSVGTSEMQLNEFSRIKTEIDSLLPAGIEAYALAWTAPYRVGCMSITSAFAFGFDASYCARDCRPTRLSSYFNSPSQSPAFELNVRPAMMLAGRSFTEVKALIDRGIASDGTYPRGTAYLMSTTDSARNTRAGSYPQVERAAAGLIGIKIIEGNQLLARRDVLFYFTGLEQVRGIETLTFLPGAIADHLTSFGGQLTDSSQMSALKWLEVGATGSYGTVVEPCSFPQKFPHPALAIGRYIRGASLIEAYWKSVAWPGQGVFIGEPLAAPFRLKR